MRVGVNGITLWKPSSSALLDTAEQGARYVAVCAQRVLVARHPLRTACRRCQGRRLCPAAAALCLIPRIHKQALCRRGSNHPFTGASEYAPPLPAEVQAQRWAEDYDSYKVGSRA